MSFYPQIPISFFFTGDKTVAASMSYAGRKHAGELFYFLSGGYGNPYFDDIDSRLFSGKSGPFYYLTKTGHLVTIKVQIDGVLTKVMVDAVVFRKKGGVKTCGCCRDCIAIGTIISGYYDVNLDKHQKYIVDLCVRVDNTETGLGPKVRISDGIYPADGNPDFIPGEKYIVFATPALKNYESEPPVSSDDVPITTNLRTWNGIVQNPAGSDTYFRRTRIWQVFNCMELSDVSGEQSLLDVGIDNSLYTVSEDVCGKGENHIPLTDPEEGVAEAEPINFILSSIKVGKCLELHE